MITLHHFAGSGGTILSKAIAAMDDVVVVSEIHPDRHERGEFHPLVQLQEGYGEQLDDSDRLRVDTHFIREIELAHEIAAKHGRQLIIRDHAYRDFVQTDRFHSRLVDLLDADFKLAKLVSVRDPVDCYLSHRTQEWFNGEPDAFCRRFLRFVDTFTDAIFVRYEDFVDAPALILQSVCSRLDLRFNADFAERIAEFRHFTGDFGRQGDEIGPRPRRPVGQEVADAFASSRSYVETCERFGYSRISGTDSGPDNADGLEGAWVDRKWWSEPNGAQQEATDRALNVGVDELRPGQPAPSDADGRPKPETNIGTETMDRTLDVGINDLGQPAPRASANRQKPERLSTATPPQASIPTQASPWHRFDAVAAHRMQQVESKRLDEGVPRPSYSPDIRIHDPGVSAKKCVVIGDGPSLDGVDLTRLSNVDTIGMNAAYRHWERMGWYPTHYACLDDEMIDTHHVEIARLMDEGLCETAFLSGQFLFHHPEAANDDRFVFLDEFVPYWFEKRGKQFHLQNRTRETAFESSQVSRLTTGSHAIRYAIWLGYTDIALFDDYQRAVDRFNVPNPDLTNGDLHLACFRALRDDLAAKDMRARVMNANPVSELSRQGVFPFQDLDAFLGVRSLGAVVVPCVASSQAQILANLKFWARPQAAPMLWPRNYKPDLVFSFNNGETGDALEPAISEAFNAHNLSRYFNTLGFERLDLRGEADLYQIDYTKPVGPQGHKAGPNNQFFETMRRVRRAGRYVFYMEPDCVPIRPDWLGQLLDHMEHVDAWIIGSVYRGRGMLDRHFMRHLNGNAIYAVGDAAFQDFLVDLETRLVGLVAEDPRVAYDLAVEILFARANCNYAKATDGERALWRYFQPIAHRFHATDYIQNISVRIDVEEPDPALLADVRADSPGTYIIHNSALARALTAQTDLPFSSGG